ncbi:YwdI family protein [Chungangia koreensis]|uniref:YwdI family protein n=2 Tax=Chungangia koreensis TaxID=752657 RepID=A0ABV8X8Q4_9LACT
MNKLLSEMEKQLAAAKTAGDEQMMREALSAIRSLCEVALSAESHPGSLKLTAQQSPPVLRHEKLQEEDANGDSIFDF